MSTTMVDDDLLNTVSVELPRKHRNFVFGLLAVVLVVWERVWAWNHGHHVSSTPIYFVLCTIGFVLVSLISFWRGFARYWVRVSPSELIFDITALGLHQIKRYPRSAVSNLRVDEQRVFTYRPWLAFDRNGQRRFIGVELDESKLDGLLDPIYLRFPEIACGKRETAVPTASERKNHRPL